MQEELLKASYIIIITLIVGFIIACGIGIVLDRANPPAATIVVYTTVEPTPTPTIYPSSLPSMITYTVRSVDLTNLEVVTTAGDILYFESRNVWSKQVKRCTYTATIEHGNIVKGYPELEVAYIAPNNEHNRGKYIEV
jgi:hypothetical protein